MGGGAMWWGVGELCGGEDELQTHDSQLRVPYLKG